MAGNSPIQRRWWILIATILSGCIVPSRSERFSHAPLPLENIVRRSTDTGADIVIFLRERCDDRTVNVTQIRNVLDRNILDLSLDVIPRSLTCETRSWGLGSLIHVLGRTTTKALIAALDSSTCEVAAKLAHLWNKPLLTWSCPLVNTIDKLTR